MKDILDIPFKDEEDAFNVHNTQDWKRLTKPELLNYVLVITAQRNEYRRRLEHIVGELKKLKDDLDEAENLKNV